MANPRKWRLAAAVATAAMAFVALMVAGWCTLQAQDAARQEGEHMHQAMALQALHVMEGIEYQAAQAESHYVDVAYKRAVTTARQYAHQATTVDAAQQAHYQERGTELQELAQLEQDQAAALWKRVDETDAERLQLIQQIQQERQAEEDALQELREDEDSSWTTTGPCSWRGIHHACAVLGGTTQLQNTAHQLDAAVHRDLVQLNAVEHREFIEFVLAQALQRQAGRYQAAADQSLRTAAAWHQRAVQDAQEAARWNRTASALAETQHEWQARLEAYQQAATRLSQSSQHLLAQARHEQRRSRAWSMAALLLVLPCGIYYSLLRVAPAVLHWMGMNLYFLFEDPTKEGSRERKRTQQQLLHDGLYSLVHVAVFLTVAGWCSKYLSLFLEMEQHQHPKLLEQRAAAVILYFSLVAAVTQTILLHTAWHLYDEFGSSLVITTTTAEYGGWLSNYRRRRWWRTAVVNPLLLVGRYSLVRLASLVPLFVLEMLTVCVLPLAARRWLLHPPSGRQAALTQLFGVVSTALYYYYVIHMNDDDDDDEDGTNSHSTSDDDGQSTVLLSQQHQDDADDAEDDHHHKVAGETSHLLLSSSSSSKGDDLGTHYSPTPTDLVPHLYLSGVEETNQRNVNTTLETASHYSLPQDSPHFVALRNEATKLLFCFELFATFCTYRIIQLACHNLLGQRDGPIVVVIVVLMILLVAGVVGYYYSNGQVGMQQMQRHGPAGVLRHGWFAFTNDELNENTASTSPPKVLYV